MQIQSAAVIDGCVSLHRTAGQHMVSGIPVDDSRGAAFRRSVSGELGVRHTEGLEGVLLKAQSAAVHSCRIPAQRAARYADSPRSGEIESAAF